VLCFLFNGYQVSFQGVKRPGLEFAHSPPHSAEVKNEWSYASVPLICLRGMDTYKFTSCRYLDLFMVYLTMLSIAEIYLWFT